MVRRHFWLASLLRIAGHYHCENVTAPWLASWAPHLGLGMSFNPLTEIGDLLAAVIDAGGPLGDEVFDILVQSLRNEHEIGGMGRHVTRALLCGSRADGWEWIEKTLLAAQRQEGLRQAILGTTIDSHPQAFRRMLRLVREHNLARFSAVVEAVKYWFDLGWDSATSATVNAVIDKALRCLDDEAARSLALDGADAEGAFLALWSIALEDAHRAIPAAARLLAHPNAELRYIAALHLGQLDLPEADRARLAALDDADPRVAWCALTTGALVHGQVSLSGDDLFERLERLVERLPAKPERAKPLVWPWTATSLDREVVAQGMIGALSHRPPTRLLPYLQALSRYSRRVVIDLLAQQKTWDRLTRDSLIDLAGGSVSDIRAASYGALAQRPLERDEPQRLEGYLSRKANDLRLGVIGLLLKQDDSDALASAGRLLTAKNAHQRLAGLELLRQLAESGRQTMGCQERAESYRRSHRQLTQEEQTQVAAIQQTGCKRVTLDDALGLMDPAERSPIVPPQKHRGPFITDAAVACLNDLDELVHTERETMVNYHFKQYHVHRTLGTCDYAFPDPDWGCPPEQSERPMPLRQIWEKWRDRRAEALRDPDGMELIRAYAWARVESYTHDKWEEWAGRSAEHLEIVRTLTGGPPFPKLRYQRVVRDVLRWLVYLDAPPNAVNVLLDTVETALALVPARLHRRLVEMAGAKPGEINESGSEPDWRLTEPFEFWLGILQEIATLASCKPTRQQWARYWQFMHWLDEPVPGAERRRPDLAILEEAYAAGAATQADWYDHLLGPRQLPRYGVTFVGNDLHSMTSRFFRKENEAYFERCPEIRSLVDRCRERILMIELGRGEEATAATLPALYLGSLYGTDTLLRILTALGSHAFKIESYRDQAHGPGRAATLTRLAGITYPELTDTPADFAAKLQTAVSAGHIPAERVLQLAFHAPQWTPFIEAYLDWPSFSEGLYWFLAHMKSVGNTGDQAALGAGITQEENDDESPSRPSAWNRLIADRTPLTDAERAEGAVDMGWFQTIYAQLTPKRWDAMARAARYAATPAAAKHAQLIADVLSGRASRKELIAGIRKARLRENVRLLGLLPLKAGAGRGADLAERYRVLQEYRCYARDLSAMSKESALRAVEIGLQNLARTAGYADPLRLEWAMEGDSVKDLSTGAVVAECDGITVTLSLDEHAWPQLTVSRGGKQLKTIPPAIKKKDKGVAALAEARPS